MDAKWPVPTQPDYLELGVDQSATHPQFLEEQDVMDVMLWGGLPTPPINPTPDSEDATGLEEDSITDLGCVCDFPPLYCEQHDVYSDVFVENDMSLPSSGPEQIIAYPDDVLESSELDPGRLELTEENFTDQTLSLDLFGMGHANPSMPSNDQVSSLYTTNGSLIPIKPPVKQRSRRSKISSMNRHILMAFFSRKRYPGTREMDELQERTGLNGKCIKTWFVNTRHRTAHDRSPVASSLQESRERSVSETPSQASTSVSVESLKELDRVSPARSTTSLERYLAIPLIDEAIPSAAVESLSETCSKMLHSDIDEQLEAQVERLMKMIREQQAQLSSLSTSLQAEQRITNVAGSVAGSDSSIDSGTSVGSWISQKSVDSRGPRRGRKNWVQDPNQFTCAASPPKTEEKRPATADLPKLRPWYCTWSSCNKSFQFRYEWDRHETAVHHWPYHWVCNLGEQPSEVHKDAASRIFYREDQLLVHMRNRHRGVNVTKHSISILKQDNPNFNPGSLRCGFCRQVLRNWEQRQDHLAAHMQGGLPKSSWVCWKEQVSVRTKDRKPSDEFVLPSWEYGLQ